GFESFLPSHFLSISIPPACAGPLRFGHADDGVNVAPSSDMERKCANTHSFRSPVGSLPHQYVRPSVLQGVVGFLERQCTYSGYRFAKAVEYGMYSTALLLVQQVTGKAQ